MFPCSHHKVSKNDDSNLFNGENHVEASQVESYSEPIDDDASNSQMEIQTELLSSTIAVPRKPVPHKVSQNIPSLTMRRRRRVVGFVLIMALMNYILIMNLNCPLFIRKLLMIPCCPRLSTSRATVKGVYPLPTKEAPSWYKTSWWWKWGCKNSAVLQLA